MEYAETKSSVPVLILCGVEEVAELPRHERNRLIICRQVCDTQEGRASRTVVNRSGQVITPAERSAWWACNIQRPPIFPLSAHHKWACAPECQHTFANASCVSVQLWIELRVILTIYRSRQQVEGTCHASESG